MSSIEHGQVERGPEAERLGTALEHVDAGAEQPSLERISRSRIGAVESEMSAVATSRRDELSLLRHAVQLNFQERANVLLLVEQVLALHDLPGQTVVN